MNTNKGNYLIPIGISFFAIAAFLLVLNYAISKPKTTNTSNKTNVAAKNTNEGVDGSANANTNSTVATNTNTATNTNSAVTQGTTLTPAKTLQVQSSIYTWHGGSISKLALADGATSGTFTFPTSGTVDAVAYNDQTNAIAYITTNGPTDTLKFRYKDNDTFWRLDTTTRTAGDVGQAIHYGSVAFMGNDFVVGTIGGWEGCDSKIFSVLTKKLVHSSWCGTTSVSPDGKRFVVASVAGMGTGNDFSVATSAAGPFVPVDWTKVNGDTKGFYGAITPELEVGFDVVRFLSNDEVLVLVSPSGDTAPWYATMNFKTSTFKKVAFNKTSVEGSSTVMGRTIVGVAEDAIRTYNLDTKQTTSFVLGADLIQTNPDESGRGTFSNIQVRQVTPDAVVVAISTDDRSDEYQSKKTVVIDPIRGQYRVLGNTADVGIAGLVTK